MVLRRVRLWPQGVLKCAANDAEPRHARQGRGRNSRPAAVSYLLVNERTAFIGVIAC